jgi:hypothetical protein
MTYDFRTAGALSVYADYVVRYGDAAELEFLAATTKMFTARQRMYLAKVGDVRGRPAILLEGADPTDHLSHGRGAFDRPHQPHGSGLMPGLKFLLELNNVDRGYIYAESFKAQSLTAAALAQYILATIDKMPERG